MTISLQKGGNLSLTKEAPDLKRVVVACGWDANQGSGPAYDLDLTVAALDASGRVPALMDPTDPGYQEWFVHANHRYPSGRSIVFKEDNRTGKGDGDDEEALVDLPAVPSIIERIIFGVVIWRAEERRQKFGNVRNAFIRIYNQANRLELARFDLGPDFQDETFVMFGELYRRGMEWKLKAVGQGYLDAATYRSEFGIVRAFETEYARPNYPRSR